MEEEDQRFESGGGQGDDAELQLMLQLVLRNLLLPDSQRECSTPLQGMAECEETLQVVVLLEKRRSSCYNVTRASACLYYSVCTPVFGPFECTTEVETVSLCNRYSPVCAQMTRPGSRG